MTTWMTTFDFTTDKPLTEDLAFDVMETLGEHGAICAFNVGKNDGSICMNLDADDITKAGRMCVTECEQALPNMNITPVAIDVVEWGEAERRIDKPTIPPLVGYAEIGKMAGVSRQRARMFTQIPKFPVPVIETGQGPLFLKAAVESWLERRNTKPGRPAKNKLD